ncbi:MAG TPA: dienelactone hydrolase family protein [Tepidisphaeraceae bacterium]|nr:dienelactone hydrolase family protein [Tepidisphaeraceae bacterium]
MSQITLQIKTQDGSAPSHFFQPQGQGPWPAVIFYMDAFGPRPDLFQMADRLASNGYCVLLPDLFYRTGPYAPFTPATAFNDPVERQRLMKHYGALTNRLVMSDTAAFLDFLANHPNAKKETGCVGYCMGGPLSLSAAGTFPDRVLAAASFHGARLATDKPDSPHLLAPKMRGEIYVGIAGLDDHFPPEEKVRLESALAAAHVRHTVEVYDGAKHGFAVNGVPAYDRTAAEKHWKRLLDLFERNLQKN